MKPLVCLAALLIACRPSPRVVAPPPRALSVTSNIERADYAGSVACARCHAGIAAAWSASAMHNMTRVSTTATVHAPFDGTGLDFKGDRVRAESENGERWVSVSSHAQGEHRYRVTRVIGGHHREDFVGIEPGGDGVERVLPISWLIESRRWRYKGYSVMVKERPGIFTSEPWARTCIFCHNTAPYLDSLIGTLAGETVPSYQGVVVDQHLPADHRWKVEVTNPEGLRRAVHKELRAIGALPSETQPLSAILLEGVKDTRNHFGADQLVEIGIGCESCHGGSREHVEDPRVRTVFGVKSPLVHTTPAASSRAESINRVCARCHQVLFSRYPWTWEGQPRANFQGGSNINSGEARDFLLGHCSGALACTSCHDPHSPDNRARMDELEGADGDRVCQRCHTKYSTPSAIAGHTHHLPEGKGARCLACHMPRKNMSLELRLTRYHRIGSPTDTARVEHDRPLECALCHADKSVETIVSDMERLWTKHYDRTALSLLYGMDLSVNALLVSLASPKPHEVATAAAALGEAKSTAAIPLLIEQLANEIPLVREYVLHALETIRGAPAPFSLHQDVTTILEQANRWLEPRN